MSSSAAAAAVASSTQKPQRRRRSGGRTVTISPFFSSGGRGSVKCSRCDPNDDAGTSSSFVPRPLSSTSVSRYFRNVPSFAAETVRTLGPLRETWGEGLFVRDATEQFRGCPIFEETFRELNETVKKENENEEEEENENEEEEEQIPIPEYEMEDILSRSVRHLCGNNCYLRAYAPAREWHALRKTIRDAIGYSPDRMLRGWRCCALRPRPRPLVLPHRSHDDDDGDNSSSSSQSVDGEKSRESRRRRDNGEDKNKKRFHPRVAFVSPEGGVFGTVTQVLRKLNLLEHLVGGARRASKMPPPSRRRMGRSVISSISKLSSDDADDVNLDLVDDATGKTRKRKRQRCTGSAKKMKKNKKKKKKDAADDDDDDAASSLLLIDPEYFPPARNSNFRGTTEKSSRSGRRRWGWGGSKETTHHHGLLSADKASSSSSSSSSPPQPLPTRESHVASPFGLIEELFPSDPWKLLLSTIMLNQTTRNQVDPVLHTFLSRWPTPTMASKADARDVREVVSTLGLQHKRARAIVRYSREYLHLIESLSKKKKNNNKKNKNNKEKKEEEEEETKTSTTLSQFELKSDSNSEPKPEYQFTDKEVLKLHWCGKYALGAYQIFVRDQLDVPVTDHALHYYVDWMRSERGSCTHCGGEEGG